MNPDQWTAVDSYLNDVLVRSDESLEQALAHSAEAGLPAISVSPTQGKFLMMLARIQGARRILEIGTLGGYSTIWFAKALPADGRIITIESEAKHAEVARENIVEAGFGEIIDVRVGKALDVLPDIAAENVGPFDFSFIDADKPNIPEYFDWALRLSRSGSIIIVDNVIREGAVINADSEDESVQGVRRLNEYLALESSVTATTIQTVGSKGYDGFTIAVVNG
ncbi:MAG: O-methyltransferase [Gemmatimonadota bacterium]|nr:O-methyltransferase [Gemmatimonadota bacterium]